MGCPAFGVQYTMPDCPLYVDGPADNRKAVELAEEKVFSVDGGLDCHGQRPDGDCVQPTHAHALPEGIMIFENLRVPESLSRSYGQGKAVLAELLMIPYDSALVDDGIVCQLFLRPLASTERAAYDQC